MYTYIMYVSSTVRAIACMMVGNTDTSRLGDRYRAAAEAPPPSATAARGADGGTVPPRPSGAVLLAVLRGRSSEGLNFSHDHARAVVMVSIAFPPIHDLKVASKRSRPLGAEWYTGQASR